MAAVRHLEFLSLLKFQLPIRHGRPMCVSMPDVAFVRSLLRAGVQPTLDPSAETFMAVQCASPGRVGELVVV